jgi:hypothetical protein
MAEALCIMFADKELSYRVFGKYLRIKTEVLRGEV